MQQQKAAAEGISLYKRLLNVVGHTDNRVMPLPKTQGLRDVARKWVSYVAITAHTERLHTLCEFHHWLFYRGRQAIDGSSKG